MYQGTSFKTQAEIIRLFIDMPASQPASQLRGERLGAGVGTGRWENMEGNSGLFSYLGLDIRLF